MKIRYFIETKKEFDTEEEARDYGKLCNVQDSVILHIHKHDDITGENGPCEIIDLK